MMSTAEQRAAWRAEYRRRHPLKPTRTFYSEKHGRVMTHHRYSVRIFWSKNMMDFLRAHYPTMLNDELAGCLGVSPRTVIRKARELGLKKDARWLSEVWEERRRWACIAARHKGYPGAFKKGQHASPATEFKPKRLKEKLL